MGTNCAPLLVDLCVYLCKAEFTKSLITAGKKQHLNSTSHIDTSMTYCPSIIQLLRMILVRCIPLSWDKRNDWEQHILDLLLSIGGGGGWGQLRTYLYDKRDDFNFHIINFPFLSSSILSLPVYGVFISQLQLYARACSSYEYFILRAVRLSCKLLG